MPKLPYIPKRFAAPTRYVIAQANAILDEYAEQGYDLTLRQLYYQFVARDLFPDDRTWRKLESGRWVRDANGTKNADPNYDWLGGIVNDGRLAGLIDWDQIVDRTRKIEEVTTWKNPAEIIIAASSGFKRDLWEPQDVRIEVWVEKEALAGVVERACEDLRLPFFSCRGYTSQSAMWAAAQRFYGYTDEGKRVKVLHLGDHDPSGIDMTRDIQDRILLFMANDRYREQISTLNGLELSEPSAEILQGEVVEWAAQWFSLDRLALNWDQVDLYNPPPNPAKLSDSRGASYVEEYGDESWELDALEPTVMGELIRDAVSELRDEALWDAATEREEEEREVLTAAAERWPDVVRFLS